MLPSPLEDRLHQGKRLRALLPPEMEDDEPEEPGYEVIPQGKALKAAE